MADKKPLREQFKQHLEQTALDDQTLDAMLHKLQNKPHRPTHLTTLYAGAAAVILMVGAWLTSLPPINQPNGQIPQRLVEEVIMNHLHLRQMEVLTTSFDDLKISMEKLNFEPVLPNMNSDLTLVGGRYCTLKGALATQLLFNSTDGHSVTMFQAAYDHSRFGTLPRREDDTAPIRVIERGVKVDVWVEQGVVMAKAQSRS